MQHRHRKLEEEQVRQQQAAVYLERPDFIEIHNDSLDKVYELFVPGWHSKWQSVRD